MQRVHYRWLWAVIALAVVLHLGAALYLGDRIEVLPGIHDQLSYDALARSILAGKGYTFDQPWYPFTPANTPTAHWSFLYPLFLVGVYGVFGYHPLMARLIQAVLSGTLLPWLVYRLGRRLFDERIGLVSAALSTVYIYFIYYDASLMTESFYTLGVLAMLNVVMRIGEWANKRVRVTGYVPDPRSYLEQAAVFIVPLHSGGGMRVKILDAWRWGLPVVSTSIGVEGIDHRDGENILVADNAESFAQAVVQVLREPALAERLRENGRRWVEERYDWRKVYKAWDVVYGVSSPTVLLPSS